MSGLVAGFGQPGGAGFLTPGATAPIGPAAATSAGAVEARAKQLALGTPGSLSTSTKMDLGQLPSITGGIPAEAGAVGGQLQNEALALNPTGSGKNTSLAGILGGLGRGIG